MNPIGRFRAIGLLEGASYVLLLFVAMPLKYGLGFDLAVRYVGMAHGILFLAYCGLLWHTRTPANWSLWRSGQLFVVSLVPFGNFLVDKGLKREEQAWKQQHTSTSSPSTPANTPATAAD
jgi:integral membrane protein